MQSRRCPTLLDVLLLVAGYAGAFVLGLRIEEWPLYLAHDSSLFLQEGWRVWLRFVALGPLLAIPTIWLVHREVRPSRGMIPGAAIAAVIGAMKLIQLGEQQAFHALFGEYHINLGLLYLEVALSISITAIALLTRGWRSARWFDRVGIVLGVAWSVDALANVYGILAFPRVTMRIYVL